MERVYDHTPALLLHCVRDVSANIFTNSLERYKFAVNNSSLDAETAPNISPLGTKEKTGDAAKDEAAEAKLKAAQNPDKKRVVLIDAFATWCGPCKAMEPVLDEYVFHPIDFYLTIHPLTCPNRLSRQYAEKVHFVQIDVDESPDVAHDLNIRAMPTFTIFKDGKKYDEIVGAKPPQLKALVAKVVAEIGA